MATPIPTRSTILPELPLGLAAACLALALLSSVADIHDRRILVGFFLTAAAVSVVVSFLMARRRSDAAHVTDHA